MNNLLMSVTAVSSRDFRLTLLVIQRGTKTVAISAWHKVEFCLRTNMRVCMAGDNEAGHFTAF